MLEEKKYNNIITKKIREIKHIIYIRKTQLLVKINITKIKVILFL